VHGRLPVGAPGERLVLAHQRRPEPRVFDRPLMIAEEPHRPIKLREVLIELPRKTVIKKRPRPPDESKPKFPDGLSLGEEFLITDPQVPVQMRRQDAGGSFAHANDPDFPGSDDRNVNLWQPALERDGRQEPRAPAADDDDSVHNHLQSSVPKYTAFSLDGCERRSVTCPLPSTSSCGAAEAVIRLRFALRLQSTEAS